MDFALAMASLSSGSSGTGDSLRGQLASTLGAHAGSLQQLSQIQSNNQAQMDQAWQQFNDKRLQLKQQLAAIQGQIQQAQQQIQGLNGKANGINQQLKKLQNERTHAEQIKDKVQRQAKLTSIDNMSKMLQQQLSADTKQITAQQQHLLELKAALKAAEKFP